MLNGLCPFAQTRFGYPQGQFWQAGRDRGVAAVHRRREACHPVCFAQWGWLGLWRHPRADLPPLAASVAEAIWLVLPSSEGAISANAVRQIPELLDKKTAILIGPG